MHLQGFDKLPPGVDGAFGPQFPGKEEVEEHDEKETEVAEDAQGQLGLEGIDPDLFAFFTHGMPPVPVKSQGACEGCQARKYRWRRGANGIYVRNCEETNRGVQFP